MNEEKVIQNEEQSCSGVDSDLNPIEKKNPENVPASDSQENQTSQTITVPLGGQKQSGRKKPSASIIGIAICGGVFLVSVVLALLLDNLIGHFVLLGTGIVDLVIAFIMASRAAQRARLICPECGTHRVEHREYLETTKTEKFFERDPNKKPDESIRFLISFKHWYLASYTCPKCGETMQEKVSDGGGVVTIYYSGREKDTRTQPREF